jgi:DNA polymerase-1
MQKVMDMERLKTTYAYIDNDEKLHHELAALEGTGAIGVDTETTGLDPLKDRLMLLQLAASWDYVLVIDMAKLGTAGWEQIREVLRSSRVKVFQNAKFDLKFLKMAGLEVKGPIFDTMLAAQIIHNGQAYRSNSLEALAEQYLGIALDKSEQKSDWSRGLMEAQLEYAARDAAVLLPLRESLIAKIKEGHLVEVCKLEFECLHAVVEMELKGILLDSEAWALLHEKYLKEQQELSDKLLEELGQGVVQMNFFGEEKTYGINLDSHQQVIKAFKSKGIDLESTSHYQLMEYKDKSEMVEWFMEYRRVTKAIQSFLSPLPQYISSATGRLHPSYYQLGAHSGRFSCGNPNIQQIPRGKEFRDCFIPAKGNKLIIADYSQIELRVAAEIAEDTTMMAAYRQNMDLHALTASLVANKPIELITKQERQAAKAVNFGLIYAMGAKGLQGYARTVYGVDLSLKEAELFKSRFFAAYKGIAKWHERMKKAADIRECRTLTGRRVLFREQPGITGLLNLPVQGTAADIVKKALSMLVPVTQRLGGSIIATVHDEVLLEVSAAAAKEAACELKRVMEEAGACYLKKVPVVAETLIADSWADK